MASNTFLHCSGYDVSSLNQPETVPKNQRYQNVPSSSINCNPRAQQDQYFFSRPDMFLNPNENVIYHLASTVPFTNPIMDWPTAPFSNQYVPVGGYHRNSLVDSVYPHEDLYPNGLGDASARPRTWHQNYRSRMGVDSQSGNETQQYFIPQDDRLAAFNDEPEYYTHEISQHLLRDNHHNLTADLVDGASYKVSDESEDATVSSSDDPTSEEPYAKLIYKALLGAANHSMVLQEIYAWFMINTDKGKSSSSGWRNSIRHNLSMNAAFRKTERKCDTADDAKKTSVWVLEPDAIKNGVSPTTRYRTKTKKTFKADSPTPSRVLSGRKGGISARRAKFQRQKSGPVESARSTPRERRGKQMQSNPHVLPKMTPLQFDSRQISPSTPTTTGGMNEGSPYYYKDSPYDESLDMQHYALEDITGLYNDDGPIFCHDGLPRFGDGRNSYMWPSS